MSNDKYYDLILGILTEKGELGVNEIARLAELPLSTVQKYLERQTYFKKTERRKWDLPQNVTSDIKSETMTLMVASVENALMLVKAQLTETLDSVQNSILPISTLKRGISGLTAPVAAKSVDIDTLFIELDKGVKENYALFKKYISKVPEEYQEMIKNVDLARLTAELGHLYVQGDFGTEISSLMLEKTTDLSDDIVEILKEYQKGA